MTRISGRFKIQNRTHGLRALPFGLAAMLAGFLPVMAETVAVTNLPPAHVGWEASKDVSLPALASDSRVFRAEFTFTATASNNVQVAFGKDADKDGKLPAEETAVTVGWDRGAWFIRTGDLRTAYTNMPTGYATAASRALKMSIRLNAGGNPLALSFRDQDGAVITFDGLVGVPAWISPEEWDTAALTARGWDVRDEQAAYSFVLDGTHILLR